MDRVRILMLETNRFRALLLQRALTSRVSGSVPARFDNARDAAEEMLRGVYAAAIINLDDVSVADAAHIFKAFQDHRPSVVMLLVSRETSRQALAILGAEANVVQIEASTAPERVAEQLADRLRRAVPLTVTSRRESTGYVTRMTIAGE